MPLGMSATYCRLIDDSPLKSLTGLIWREQQIAGSRDTPDGVEDPQTGQILRPNIILAGDGGWRPDGWREIHWTVPLGSLYFKSLSKDQSVPDSDVLVTKPLVKLVCQVPIQSWKTDSLVCLLPYLTCVGQMHHNRPQHTLLSLAYPR